ncbi:MAG: serine hydrolase [Thermomicrobiales bacterium]
MCGWKGTVAGKFGSLYGLAGEPGLKRTWRGWAWVFAVWIAATAVVSTHGPVAAAEIAHYEPLAPPPLSADAVYVVDVSSNTELFSENADEPLPPASLTKVAAALVILEQADFNDVVTIEQDDLVDLEQSQVGLVAGDRLTVADLFVGMLVPSGNDASLALARYLGQKSLGTNTASAEAIAWFVGQMNETAARHGATNSHFANPTGIDADGHVMSARDVAQLTKVALSYPMFVETVGKTQAQLRSELRAEGYTVYSTNELLGEGLVTGVKTGTTDKAGGCLVTSFSVDGNEIVSVVLGSDLTQTADGEQDNSARFADTRELISAVNDDFVWIDPEKDAATAGLPVELSVWNVALESEALQPVPVADLSSIRYRLVLGSPAAPDAPAGDVLFLIGDKLLSERTAVQVG